MKRIAKTFDSSSQGALSVARTVLDELAEQLGSAGTMSIRVPATGKNASITFDFGPRGYKGEVPDDLVEWLRAQGWTISQ